MISPKFNVIIVKKNIYMFIILINIKVPLTIRKGKPTMLKRKIKKNLLYCWHIKEKMRRKTHGILTLKRTVIHVDSKIDLWNLMNQKVTMLLLEMHPKFQ